MVLIRDVFRLHREKKNDILSQIKNIPQGTITQETQLDFHDFVQLFRSFKYVKDLLVHRSMHLGVGICVLMRYFL